MDVYFLDWSGCCNIWFDYVIPEKIIPSLIEIIKVNTIFQLY